MLTPGEHSGIDKAKALWEPVLQKMSTFPNMTNFTVKYYDYTSYKHYFDVRLGPLCEETEMPGHSHEEEEPGHTHEAEGPNPIPLPTGSAAPTGPAGDGHDHEHRSIDSFEKIERSLWKRHEGMDAPMGIMPMDSRLLGKKHFDHPEFARALKAAYPLVPGGLLRGHLIGGGKVLRPTEPTSVLPAWRRA